jgi:hypothetical protein
MSVRWIGDAARELSLDIWDAIAFLAKEDEYPLNGLLDEERFQLLKRAARKGMERISLPAGEKARDKGDEKTAIYPPPG